MKVLNRQGTHLVDTFLTVLSLLMYFSAGMLLKVQGEVLMEGVSDRM